MKEIIARTNAYKVISADKKGGSLSHAYLVTCPDEEMLPEYLIGIAKLIVCDGSGSKEDARTAMLIEKRLHPDVSFYPREKKLSVANADEIVASSVVKPLELKTRLFILNRFEDLAQYQNKLLKTLEEPPENVILLLGTVNENAVLSTVKSRSKIVSVPLFSEGEIVNALSGEFGDEKKLRLSAALSGGRIGEARRFYLSPQTESLMAFADDVFYKMNAASDVLTFSARMNNFEIKDVLSALKVVCGKIAEGDKNYEDLIKRYRPAVFIGITDKLNKLEKTVNFNGNANMVGDGILFSVMEEKARWQRLSV